jgi:Pyruvate/2-oxoacid:ferredoxin oxidoreductase gamma subunit
MRRERVAFAAAGDYVLQFTAPGSAARAASVRQRLRIIEDEIEARDSA